MTVKKLWVLTIPAAVAVAAYLYPDEAPKRGAALRYDVELDGKSRAQLGAPEQPVVVDSRYAVAASVELQPTTDAPGAPMALTFLAVERATVEVLGEAALDATGIAGRTFFIDGDALVSPADATLDHRRLAQLVASELAVELSDERNWTSIESGLLGRVESKYERDGETIVRDRVAYATLRSGVDANTAKVTGRDAIEIEDGRLRSLVGSEEVVAASFVAEASRRIVRVGVEIARPIVQPPKVVRHVMSEPIVSGTAQDRAVRDRIDGLTPDALVADLEAHPTGQLPHHNAWLWRATGLLRAQPEVAARLVQTIQSPAMTTGGRGLVLDLLASAGHAEAQAAMRSIVELDAVKDDPKASLLFQRFALLKQPDAATVRFLTDARNTAGDIDRYTASTVSLGAAAARVEGGDRIAQGLLADLSAETDEDRLRAIVAGVGNTRYEPAASELAAKARTFSPRLRAATASALRHLHSDQARALALALARDPVDLVQVRALHALRKQGLRPQDIAGLDPRPLAELALPAFVTLLEPHVNHPDARRALTQVLARKADPQLKARVRDLLQTP
ncbi:MAG: hypothetical protein RMA76_03770 [Deltaproteobacteria bacterium]|jgi:hypothetical protein